LGIGCVSVLPADFRLTNGTIFHERSDTDLRVEFVDLWAIRNANWEGARFTQFHLQR
jgi:hypothetical protein